jgi:1,4-dihydroxy-2-naphthoate octaprenyltransferase
MPVYLFALSQVPQINWSRAVLVFFILHLLVYPASNGYNSFMDRDTESIGGIEKPLQPTNQLLWVCYFLDLLAVALSLFISWYFAVGILAYILASRAYSFRGIRLKKYPLAGYRRFYFSGCCLLWSKYIMVWIQQNAAHSCYTL